MSSYRSKYDPMHSAKRAAYEAQGVPPALANQLAAQDTLRAFQEDVAATLPRDADGRASLSEDEAAFDASMADAMGQSNLSAAATPIAMEPELSAPVYRRAPGPVDYGTGEAEAGEDIYDPEAAAAYRTRVPSAMASEAQMERARRNPLYRGGQFLPSPEDDAQFRRGQVMTFDPVTGARGYSPASPTGLPVGPGEPGRLGRRLDLEQPVIDPRTGQPIQGTQKYESVPVDTPFGKHDVYRPSDAFREQLDRREDVLRRERLASAAGPYAAEGMDLDQLRAAGRQRRSAQREARQAEVTRRAMARQNPTALMDPEWRQHVLAVGLLGRNAGPSPSAVRAAELAQPPRPPDPMVVVQAQEAREEAAVLVEARKRAANGHTGMSLLGYNEYDQAEYVLRGMGLTPAQREQVLQDLFPAGKPLYPWQEREAAERAAGGG
jgi:hypothetical protein